MGLEKYYIILKLAKEGYDCPGLGLNCYYYGFHSDKISNRNWRVCRFEPGKHAEIFVLCLKGAQDQQMVSKSFSRSLNTLKLTNKN